MVRFVKVVSNALAFADDDDTNTQRTFENLGSNIRNVASTPSSGSRTTVAHSDHIHAVSRETIDDIISNSFGPNSTTVSANRGITVSYNDGDNMFYFEDRITTGTVDPTDAANGTVVGSVYIRTE